MTDEQFTTILKLFANLGDQILTLRQDMNNGFAGVTREFANIRHEMATEFAAVRQEMTTGFTEVHKKMDDGFERLKEGGQEILNAVGGPFEELEAETKKTKLQHARRLGKLERHVGLA